MREGMAGIDGKVKALIDISENGAFTLPTEVIKARKAVGILSAEMDRVQEARHKVSPEALEVEMVNNLIASAS
jgi:hypothetical protein